MWYFLSPTIHFGEGALSALGELGARRALLVGDANLVRLGLVERVRSALVRNGCETALFADVEPEPSLATVRRGAAFAADFAPDWVVGVGGGSCLDAAKAIWVLYERPDLDPAAISPVLQLGLRKRACLATVPTTAGSGSEVTMGIVLTDSDEKRKLGLGNRENVADVAVVDPSLSAAMPPALTADTGLDALAHAVEAYTCRWHNDFADGPALRAARLVLSHLPRAVADGADREAREGMANAATLAGLALGNSMASLAHALGHVLGARFGIAHGRAVAIALPATVEFAAARAPERFAELAAWLGFAGAQGEGGARALAALLRRLRAEVGGPASLAEAGVARGSVVSQLEALVDGVSDDTQFVTCVRTPSYDELRRLVLSVYDGQVVDY